MKLLKLILAIVPFLISNLTLAQVPAADENEDYSCESGIALWSVIGEVGRTELLDEFASSFLKCELIQALVVDRLKEIAASPAQLTTEASSETPVDDGIFPTVNIIGARWEKLFHIQQGRSAAYSPNGKLIVSFDGNRAWIWDSQTGDFIADVLGISFDIVDIRFKSDNDTLFIFIERGAIVWSISAKRQIGSFDSGNLESASLSLDENLVAIAEPNEMTVWDMNNLSFPFQVYDFSGRWLWILPDGNSFIFLGDRRDRDVVYETSIFDGLTRERFLSRIGDLDALYLCRDGRYIVFVADARIQIIDYQSGLEVFYIELQERVNSLYISENCEYITVSFSTNAAVWRIADGAEAGIVGFDRFVTEARLSPDNTRLVVSESGEGLSVWQAITP